MKKALFLVLLVILSASKLCMAQTQQPAIIDADGVKKAAVALKDAGINAVSFVSENSRHEFQTWRRSLLELAPLLFTK